MSKAKLPVVEAVLAQVRRALAVNARRPVVIGLCGSQGSGKTTLADALAAACAAEGLRSATLSIDDLYLTRARRKALAREVHPLLATRGVPGTHDVALGMSVLEALERGAAVPLPRFDKIADDRKPQAQWQLSPAPCEVLIFEGWCIGARPQPASDLVSSVNRLEAEEDPHGIWRAYVNDALAGPYQQLFARIDRLILLAAPGFEVVHRWRLEQERELALNASPDAKVMDEVAVARFISHYERLTRYMLSEMPGRADLVVRLDEDRRPLAINPRK